MEIDEVLDRIFIAIGAVFFLLGVVMIAVPSVGESIPFGTGLIGAIGVVAALMGLLNARVRLNSELTEAETPNPERPADNPVPGDDVDRMLYEMTHLRQGILENREQLEGRLEVLAVALIRDREGCSEAEAVAMLESGSWIDDERVASFFQGESRDVEDESTLGQVFANSDESTGWRTDFEYVVETLIDYGEVEMSAYDIETDEDDGGLLSRFFGGSEESEEDETEGVESNWNVPDSSIPSYETDEAFEDVSLHRTYRWLGIAAFALVALGTGVFVSSPALMLSGSVAVGYSVYAHLNTVPRSENLEVERELSETDPEPGEEVEVTVTVHNAGDSMLPDLRLIDVVPDAFVVTEGCPRLHTALQAGSTARFEYTVVVERGEYTWPMLAVARDFSGSVERVSLVTPPAEIVCFPPLRVTSSIPVRAQTTQFAGDVSTSAGGSGLEFHSVRDYQNGDPMNRINWNRMAKTGELSTIDFRQERAATVTILFDTRQNAYVSAGAGRPHAVDQSVHAASDVFGALYDEGNMVGVAAFDTVPCWLSPGAGSEHLERARRLFAQHPALSPRPPERQDIQGSYIDPMTHIRRRLPSNSQVFLFTPLVDDYAGEVARRLDSAGHLVTVISPNTTADRTIGQRLTRIERSVRVRILRERGVRVVDWDPNDRLDLQFQKAQARWV